MLDTSIHLGSGGNINKNNGFEMDITEYPGFEDPVFTKETFMELSSATKKSHEELSSASDECKSPLAGQEMSQDLYSLIDSFNLETPIEHFDSGNTQAFQCVIDDVIDAAPSGDEFDFLDNICGFKSSDIPVKNSSLVTGAACVYTCAANKDRRDNQDTCSLTTSSTCISGKNEMWDMLSPADQELLEKLPAFLENIDSVATKTKSTCGAVLSSKREHDCDISDNNPRKKSRTDNSQTILEKGNSNDRDDSKLSRDNVCARGS